MALSDQNCTLLKNRLCGLARIKDTKSNGNEPVYLFWAHQKAQGQKRVW